MSSHKALTGVHNYVEFKEQTIVDRVKKMVAMRDAIEDVSRLEVKFSYGNRKTGQLVPSVSLIPIADCGNCKHCARGCYDVRNVCCYKASQAMRANNSAIAHKDPEMFFNDVSREMKKCRWFRFHAGADILNDGYFEGMVRCAKENPNCKVLAFTKMFDIVNRWIDKNGDLPENLQIVFSEWRGMEIDNPHNLPTSRPVWKGDHIEGIWCGGNCSTCAVNDCGCWSLKPGERILFEAH